MTIIIVTVGAAECDGDVIARIYLTISSSVILISFVLSKIGIIEDRIFIRTATGHVRHSLGMQYTTIWALFLFFIISTFIYIKKNLKKIHVVLIFMIDIYIYVATNARFETFMIIFVLFLSINFEKIFNDQKAISYIFRYSFIISAILSFTIEFLYMMNHDLFGSIDILLSGRLGITKSVIDKIGFHFFGREFFMQGFGTWDFDWSRGYNYVDSFYINYTIKYGILYMVFLCVLYTIICIKLEKIGNKWLLLFVALGSIHGIVVSSVFLPECNPFFIISFAEWSKISIIMINNKCEGHHYVNKLKE